MFHSFSSHPFEVRLAAGPADIAAAQALRYAVFVEEGGASGPMVDNTNKRDADWYDAFADHLLLCDVTRPAGDQVVGTYRMMTEAHARAAGGFYSSGEFDLDPVLNTQKSVLELGRSCVHPDYRGGRALFHLWQGLGRYVADQEIALLFGVASFTGTDPAAHAAALTLLHQEYRAAPDLAPVARGGGAIALAQCDTAFLDRRQAMLDMPALIKSYLRLGARVGEGAFIDNDFNTIDVCIVLEAANVTARQRAMLEVAV